MLCIVVGLSACSDASGVSQLALLGTQAACDDYDGLPPGWRDAEHAGMIRLPGGHFQLGSRRGYPDERPVSKETVHGFWIDATEVTNAQFRAFVKATGYVTTAERLGYGVVFTPPEGGGHVPHDYRWWQLREGADWRHPHGSDSAIAVHENAHPVVQVSRADARAYAKWLGRALPTEKQWEYAAKSAGRVAQMTRAPATPDGRPLANYWQGSFPALNLAADGHAGIAPIGCFAANQSGLYDMIGNVWEWTADAYRSGHRHGDRRTAVPSRSTLTATSEDGEDGPAVVKGGSYLCAPNFCARFRASARQPMTIDLPTSHVGFRTVSMSIQP